MRGVSFSWEVAHEAALNFVDDRTGSRVLLSSRVRGVLEGGNIVDIGFPTEEEAVEMLLTMGGVAVSSAGAPAAVPPEARAIVRYCNRLPLAIGIAAQLVKELALDGGDWNGVLSIMREEFEQGGQAQSMEESVIATSLKAIRGSQVREHLSSICDAFPCRFAALFNA